MPKLILNEFTSYELTPDEDVISKCFSDLQEMYLRNELAECAQQLLSIMPTSDPHFDQLERRHIQGKMDILRGLLTISEDTRREVMQRNRDSQQE